MYRYDLSALKPRQHDFNTIMRFEDVTMLTYGAKYYTFESSAMRQAAERINTHLKNDVKDYISHSHNVLYKEAVSLYISSGENHLPFRQYEALLYYTMTYNEPNAVSLYNDKYEYCGGAHGSTLRTSDTWWLPTGRRAILSDLFRSSQNWKKTLYTAIISQIEASLREDPGIYFDNYKELAVTAFNPANFYLTDRGLAIYYQHYDIAPYATGIPVFILPYDEIGAVMPHSYHA